MSRPTSRWARRVVLAAAFAAGFGSASGCYERVVNAKGFGASGMTVYQPNVPNESPSNERDVSTPLGRSRNE